MLRILEDIFYGQGTSGLPSGLHPSGRAAILLGDRAALCGTGRQRRSYLQDVFYLNTFGVAEYINAMEQRGGPSRSRSI